MTDQANHADDDSQSIPVAPTDTHHHLQARMTASLALLEVHAHYQVSSIATRYRVLQRTIAWSEALDLLHEYGL